MEPPNKDSKEWREWYIRHHFGSITAVEIDTATKEKLLILLKFVVDVIETKK